MTAVTKYDDVLSKLATKGQFNFEALTATANDSDAGATSGFFNVQQFSGGFQAAGVGMSVPPITADPMVLDTLALFNSGSRGMVLGWLYEIGTLDLTGTGDKFTHHSATFPLLRKRMGQAAQPVPLFPWLRLTTATATAAPQFALKTDADGAGYVDQDGNNVVGTKTFTFPLAITVVGSGFPLTIEDTDWAVRDITQIDVAVAGSTGAATIYGFEPISAVPAPTQNYVGVRDLLGESLMCPDLRPAVATSGTVAAGLVLLCLGVLGTSGVAYSNYFIHKNT